ncbi:hypothetical protein L228DRAFT_263569 [Xylona heveae TC161]|uniref:Mitochondrial chaperone BCS1 n=1 Tax=Xylona heveae (strain CBS 132557 / TC161) TaxID=1328760 RepID=A0A164ZYP9_XYLHT|nr:hypothetical protein L228DRAFT_263569 [Xylona heveae TC161]KZF19711.1 hypothetical protein L228DRAFT_263569 [Xylona heveae TC161]
MDQTAPLPVPSAPVAEPVAPVATVPINAPSPREQLSRQIAAGQAGNAGDGSILSQLKSNPFFTAGFGLAGIGACVAFAQRGLRRGASLLRRRLLVDVEISRNDESYQWFLHWMSQYQKQQLAATAAQAAAAAQGEKPRVLTSLIQRFTPGLHHLSIQTKNVVHPNGSLHTYFSLIPGPGRHVLRYKNTFIAVDRARDTKSFAHDKGSPWETVTLTTLYSDRHVFEELFAEAHKLAMQLQEGKTVMYTAWGTEWRQFGYPRRKRPLESVILDQGVKERVVEDVKDFMASEKWYFDRGIPYRRGYLLHGPPGTGKSSFIQALAGELDYSIALVNLSERGLTDDRLNHLLTNIPPRTLVLLEDVDAAFSNRRIQSDEDGYRGANVTFSGLLNALDGVASAEERIVFLTTNHVDRLDEALVRPGRVDMTVRLGEATRYQISQLWDRFYGEVEGSEEAKSRFLQQMESLGLIEDEQGHGRQGDYRPSTASLQGLFLYNKGNMEGAIAMAPGLLPGWSSEESDIPSRSHAAMQPARSAV